MSTIFLPAFFTNGGRRQRCNRYRGCELFPDCCGMVSYHPWLDEQEPSLHYLWRKGIPILAGDRRKVVRAPRQPWLHRLRIQGYDSKDVTVNVDGEKVKVHAKHEEIEGENIDRYETSRTVQIPANVNKEKLRSYFLNGGHLVIIAPYLETNKEETSKGNAKKCEEKHIMKADGQEDPKATERPNTTDGPKQDMKIEIQHEPITNTGSNGASEVAMQGTQEHDMIVETTEEGIEKEPAKDDYEHVPSDILAADTGVVKENKMENDSSLEDGSVITSPNFTHSPSEIEPATTQEKISSASDLPPLMDSREITEIDGEKVYQVSMNLKNFKPENVSIGLKDNVLSVEAEKDWNNESVFTAQKVHRKFVIPEKGKTENIKAKMNDDGFVEILVPLVGHELKNSVTFEKEHEKEGV